jgi:DnaJ-domain-containing protein 1
MRRKLQCVNEAPDYFALLDEPRRPWLDAETLKQKFFSLSAQVHPDRVHQLGATERSAADQRYKELNAAYQCLREPRDRLRHLLELESGARPQDLQEIPSELADICMEVGRLCRDADHLLAEMAQVTSALLRVQRFAAGQQLVQQLVTLQRKISERQELAVARTGDLNQAWNDPNARTRTLVELENLYRLLGFYLRWSTQVRERITRLAF